MPNDLSIKAVAAVTSASENPAEPQAASATPLAHAPPAQTASPIPNPELRLDPALGLVVIEFHDNAGTITTSIPSQRQLQAYRMWEQSGPGPPSLPDTTGPLPLGGTDSGLLHPPSAGSTQPATRDLASGGAGSVVGSGADTREPVPTPANPQQSVGDAAVHVSATGRA